MDAIGDEMKRRAAVHGDRRPGVVGENENGRVIRWVVAPPSLPRIVGPGSSDRPEHVPAHDPGSDIGESARREAVIDAARAAIVAEHAAKGTGGEGPLVQCRAADAERVLEVLIGASAVAVERYAKTLDAKLGHGQGQ